MKHPKVFISYSHDSQDFKDWVRALTDRLIKSGVEVTLDQYDLKLTMNNSEYMEKGISDNDYVILLLTKSYSEKAKERKGGVGYEVSMVTGEIITDANRHKFIPILIQIEFSELPIFLKGTYSLKIDNLSSFEDQYVQLYAYITDQELVEKPELGDIIQLKKESKHDHIDKIIGDQGKPYLNHYSILDVEFKLEEYSDYTIQELFPKYLNEVEIQNKYT